MKRLNKKGFTLAETIIVLVILGIVAAITIPALVRRHIENSNRTKIKKAMTVYDAILNKMVVENGIKDDTALETFAGNEENNCAGASQYFKLTDGSGCVFKTAEGVWWDISDIKNPIIALNRDNLNEEAAEGDENVAFRMVGHIDSNGSVRINDPKAESGDNLGYLTKLYNFVKPEVGGAGGAAGGGKIPGVGDNGLYANGCDPADNIIETDEHPFQGKKISVLDCHGNDLYFAYQCENFIDLALCDNVNVSIFDENDNMTASAWECDDPTDITTCGMISVSTYDENNNTTAAGDNCDDPTDITTCGSISVYTYDGNNNETAFGTKCDDPTDITTCSNFQIKIYDGNNMTASAWGCDDHTDITTCTHCYNADWHDVDCASLGQ